MKRLLISISLLSALAMGGKAQVSTSPDYNQINEDGTFGSNKNPRKQQDSLGTDKEIPIGLKTWTINRFGDRSIAIPDTLSHMYMNSIFTTGMRGEYNTLGNLGAPRIARIFIDRQQMPEFLFAAPYDFFLINAEDFQFTNTLSPFTNLSFNTCGNRTNGEDHFAAKFGVNAGKRLGIGFKFDYIYGRGYYSNQSTSHFNYTMYGSYLGDHYQAHLLLSTNHQKVAENGGITNDDYVARPEIFNESFESTEIPTVLEQNWNRYDNDHVFLTHRYSLGFKRKVKMTEEEIKARKFAMEAKKDQKAREGKEEARKQARMNGEELDEAEYDKKTAGKQTFSGRPDDAKVVGKEPVDTTRKANNRIVVGNKEQLDSLLAAEKKAAEDTMWMKDEYVPVTSFIHTLEFNTNRRIYQAHQTPTGFYKNTYNITERLLPDSIFDKTRFYNIKNTFALSLLEGFNKWAKAGLKAFASHDMRHYTLPGQLGPATYRENGLFIGGQLSKTEGKILHYNVLGEFGIAGDDIGTVHLNATADLNFKLFGDTATLAASGFFNRYRPSFYYRHYQGRHYMWDLDADNIIHSRIQGILSWKKTRTKLRIAIDEIKNYTYLGQSYDINGRYNRLDNQVMARQSSDAISLITAQIAQDFTIGLLNWETVLTYQKSSKEDILAVPRFNAYTNLFLRFKIAKVLKCDFGADARYFTQYYAPDYAPGLGLFTVQEGSSRTKVGNYPLVNVYANFHLKHTRFFVMMSHVNEGLGTGNYFLTPHYPLNPRILRFGLSWNFFN